MDFHFISPCGAKLYEVIPKWRIGKEKRNGTYGACFSVRKKYEVPESLTIMEAMEYSGYQLVRGCCCRNGFCGACATIYRIAGDRELKACLACSTKVENNMYVATLPFFPLVKEVYDIEKVKPTQQIMMQLYPEIYSCVGCNACTKACTQGLNVMQYIAYAQRGDMKSARKNRSTASCAACARRGVPRGFRTRRSRCSRAGSTANISPRTVSIWTFASKRSARENSRR